MVRGDFTDRNESTLLSALTCAALCAGAFAIHPALGVTMAVFIAAGLLFQSGFFNQRQRAFST